MFTPFVVMEIAARREQRAGASSSAAKNLLRHAKSQAVEGGLRVTSASGKIKNSGSGKIKKEKNTHQKM
jgi:hypothetical protein